MGITAAISPGAAQDFRMTVQKELTGSEETASNGQQKSPNSGRGELLVSKEAEEPIAFVLDDDRDDPPGSPVPAGKPAIPENHTTGTSNLLMWPAINDLVGHLLEENGIKYPKTYPLSIEENRGLLHLYGRGEGIKKPGAKEVPNDFGLLTSTPFEDATPSPLSNEWGCMGAMDTAPYSPQNIPTPEEKTPPQWGLSFERGHVWKLVKSYQDNMQNMHPIILPKDLHALITNFLESLPTVYVAKTARPIAGFAAKPKVMGNKRKREEIDDGSENLNPTRLAPSRHIGTAVVLCILALGEICLHKDRIVPTFGEMQSTGSFGSQPCGFQGSPMRRNIDVIPGLHYLANATDILGNQMAGRSIWHVYANILAGLYYGQLGRVMESYWQIHNACVKAQHLLRNHFSRLTGANGKEQDIKDTRYYLIYWTCMQLECDIIAELNLQQSGISNYEQSMLHPNLEHMIECGIDKRVACSYYGQLWLRKILNEAHTIL
uniref:Transcription factor domain-containing protein n=1 Tax=Pyricularia oryzae (strain P131) TaxID=1143193 RepID=L7JMC5_PYRO1